MTTTVQVQNQGKNTKSPRSSKPSAEFPMRQARVRRKKVAKRLGAADGVSKKNQFGSSGAQA